jgi:hypothetical protein
VSNFRDAFLNYIFEVQVAVSHVPESEGVTVSTHDREGHAVALLVEALRYMQGRSRVRFPTV